MTLMLNVKKKRPLALAFLPPRLAQVLYARLYYGKHRKYHDLFHIAPLALCPKLSMYDLLPGDAISGNIAFTGLYELALSKEIIHLARTGGLFVDVGANMGYFSLLWAGLKSENRVLAYEAAPRNVALLQKNIFNNNMDDQIKLVPKAAGSYAGEVFFDTGPAEQTGWGGISVNPTGNGIAVPLVRLDNELEDKVIDVLKIDVEGADTWVLQGCENLLKRKMIRRIYFEQNKVRMAELGIELDEAQTFLRKLGYSCVPFGKDGTEWVATP